MVSQKQKKGKNLRGKSGREAVKGKSGIAAAYCTRSRAIKKLQITLKDFRRLCILKGIFPRDPKKKAQGRDKLYYHIKDIAFLQHEPLLVKFRALKTHIKKYKKALIAKDRTRIAHLKQAAPQLTYDHLVKERYPTFVDSLRDCDDCLNLIILFSRMPSTIKMLHQHNVEVVETCDTLYREFLSLTAHQSALRHVFISVKGIYCQAEIQSQLITWIHPHGFSPRLPKSVDYRVMMCFIEFYTCMLRFVNYKLYFDARLAYPPQQSVQQQQAALTATLSSSSVTESHATIQVTKQGRAETRRAEQQQQTASAASQSRSIKHTLYPLLSIDEAKRLAVEAQVVLRRDAAANKPRMQSQMLSMQDRRMQNVVDQVVHRLDGQKHKSTAALNAFATVLPSTAAAASDDVAAVEQAEDAVRQAEEQAVATQDAAAMQLDDFTALKQPDDASTTTDANSAAAAAADQSLNLATDVQTQVSSLFKSLTFLVCREVPSQIFEFLLMSGGATAVHFDDELTPEIVASLTHVVFDRPSVDKPLTHCTYVQPQWVADSFNARALLPTEYYSIGRLCPPHLSPFVEQGAIDDYIPRQQEILKQWGAQSQEAHTVASSKSGHSTMAQTAIKGNSHTTTKSSVGASSANDDDSSDAEEQRYQESLDAERQRLAVSGDALNTTQDGSEDDSSSAEEQDDDDDSAMEQETDDSADEAAAAAPTSKAAKRAAAEEAAQKELAKIMMTKKNKRLYSQIEFGKNKRAAANDKLIAKRKQIDQEAKPATDATSNKRKKQKK